MGLPKLVQSANGCFYVHWTEDRRSNRKSLRTSDQAEAMKRFAEWLVKANTDAEREPTIGELWAAYEAKHIVKVASPETLYHAWNALRPYFENVRPSDAQDIVETYKDDRMENVAPATVRRELSALRACIAWCASGKGGRPLVKAVPYIALPPASAPRDRWLSKDEIFRLRAAVTPGGLDQLFVELALETAGRRQAITDLTWDRVDFETRVIHLQDPSIAATSKRGASVPMSDRMYHLLASQRGTGRLFPKDFGAYRAVLGAARRAGLSDVSPHVLRHTAATHLARGGVPLWKIAKILGNSVSMVERVYAKHAPDDLRDAINLISGGN